MRPFLRAVRRCIRPRSRCLKCSSHNNLSRLAPLNSNETLSLSLHFLAPGDMPLVAKRFRHVPVAIPQVRVSRGIAVSPRQ